MPRIAELWAWVSVENAPDDEGVCGFLAPDGTWMPLVGADRKRIESLRPMARLIAEKSGKPVRLVRFSARTDVEVLEPARVRA